jgi:hypothetical protein
MKRRKSFTADPIADPMNPVDEAIWNPSRRVMRPTGPERP